MADDDGYGYCRIAPGHPVHGPYHDLEYGFPVVADAPLFERLVLEISQAGLSWETILRKREGYRRAFAGFRVDAVAAMGEERVAELLADPSIVRNRRKVEATVENGRRLLRIVAEEGSFAAWLDRRHPLPLEEWLRLFRKAFVFTGPEVVREFLVSTGYLPGAHSPSCPVFGKVLALSPPWSRK